ncbi:hypothetical protein FSST1_012430 [Fusarium sambucinum]
MEEHLLDIPIVDSHNDQSLYSFLAKGISDIHLNPRSERPVTDYIYLQSVVSTLTKPYDLSQFTLLHQYPETSQRNTPYHYPSPYQDIYDNLHDYLTDHLGEVAQNILSNDKNQLMDAYFDAWELYNEAAVRVDHILNQVNATWIESHISGGIRELFHIHTLHCVKWQQLVWSRVCGLVVDGVQKAMQESYQYATDMLRLMERFRSQTVGQIWDEVDERTKIYQDRYKG